jgi:hypothetical protein
MNITQTAGTEIAAYAPSGVLALVPDLTPVRVAPAKPVKHCQAPACETVIGSHGDTPRARLGRRFCSDTCQRAGRRHERKTETADYTRMATRMIRKLGQRVGTDFDQLGELAEIAAAADQAMRVAVSVMRERGLSWALIGDQLGITRQAAQQRFGR